MPVIGRMGQCEECMHLQERLSITGILEEMRNETHVWVLGLYRLSWSANGSFEYVDMFFVCWFVCLLFFFVFCFFSFFLFFFWWREGKGRSIKGERGTWGRVEEVT